MYFIPGDKLPAHFNGRELRAPTLDKMRKYLQPADFKMGRLYPVYDSETGQKAGHFNAALNFTPVPR